MKLMVRISGLGAMVIGLCLCNGLTCCNDKSKEESLLVAVQAHEYAKVQLLLVVLGKSSPDIQLLTTLVCKDLSFSGQFQVDISHLESVPTKQQLEAYASQGHQLAIFIERQNEGKSFSWRLYDTIQPAMLKGKKLEKKGPDARFWAHEMADDLWPILTGQEGFFSTKIAYCKEVKQGKKRPRKYLCIADFDGSNEHVLVSTMVVAPRWAHNGLLFYSECTNSNVRLMYLDGNGKSHIASNFDGLNMGPSFSQDGSITVYCASRGRGSSQIYYCAPGVFKQLTHNAGTNVSPSITADGSKIYFCSDFLTGKPAIYVFTVANGRMDQIISNGMCPSYCHKNQKLAYTKNVKGTVQIFVYDTVSKESEQVTFDSGNKDECSWSPCGNYLIYGVSQGVSSRVVAFNIFSKEKKYVTSPGVVCSYPTWSKKFLMQDMQQQISFNKIVTV